MNFQSGIKNPELNTLDKVSFFKSVARAALLMFLEQSVPVHAPSGTTVYLHGHQDRIRTKVYSQRTSPTLNYEQTQMNVR